MVMNYEDNKWYWIEDESLTAIARFFKDGDGGFGFISNELYTIKGAKLPNINGRVCELRKQDIKGLATPSQIEQCLKAYAEKKGYVSGQQFRCLHTHNVAKIKGLKLKYNQETDSLTCDHGKMYTGFLYRNGKWAEIVKEEPKSTLTKTEGSMSIEMDTKEEVELPSFRYKTDDLDDVDFHTLRFWIGGKDVHIYELIEVYKLALKFKDVIV